MRSILAVAVLAALAVPAAAGPSTIHEFICKPEVHVVGGEPAFRMVPPLGFSRDPDDVHLGSQCVEGCYFEPLRIVPDGALPKGQHYLALLAPAGGATCTTTAEVLYAIPIEPIAGWFGG
jgi:hypothetical protein